MRIKKMTASFGKLKNSTMELSPGLNIVYAPNEYGKSTWCAFIKSMLYGIDSSERDKAGYIAPKNKYRPWDGTPMAGTMELTHEGRDITIQRANQGSSPMKGFLAAYTGTANFIKDMTGEDAGEKLTGVTERVFERTAFIRRPDLRINQTAELEKRISSIVSSGEEHASFTDSDAQLRSWQRKLRYGKSGIIPTLESEKHEAELKLNEINSSAEELSSLRSTISRLQKQEEMLNEDLLTHDKLDKRAMARRIAEARAKVKATEEYASKLKAQITKNGHRITREDINELRSTASMITPLRAVKTDAEKKLWQAEKELSDVISKKAASPFAGMSESDAYNKAAEASALEKEIERLNKRRIPKKIPIALFIIAAAVALFASGLVKPLSEWIPALRPIAGFSIPGLSIAAIIAAVGALMIIIKSKKPAELSQKLNAIYAQYNVSSGDKLTSLAGTYASLCHEEAAAIKTRDSEKEDYEDALNNLTEATEKAVSGIAAYMPEVRSGEEVISAINDMELTLDKLTHAEFDMISSQNVYETLLLDFDGDNEDEDEYIPIPLRNREDTVAALQRVRTQLDNAQHDFDIKTGSQRTLGDPSVIEGNIATLSERIAEATTRYNALGIAADALSAANMELQTRFSPLISKKAGKILYRLTNGKYEKIVFDKGFDASARISDDTLSHNVLTLSDGTADEIYLSLRLAMCELILDGDEPCPIILDDALLNFDDERMKSALELLMELSQNRQIILFSCHKREKEYLAGRANIIEQ